MEIYLIRHTQPATAAGTCYGQLDVPLAATATNDIAATVAKIPACDFVHSSPSSRCTRLARAISSRDGSPVEYAAGLLELNFGDWEGLTWSAIPRAQSDPWAEDSWECSPPNGESERAMWRRVNLWFETSLLPRKGRHAVVAHGGSLRILRCLILGLAAEKRWDWQISFGEVLALSPSANLKMTPASSLS